MKQRFTVGAHIMARDKNDPKAKWGTATVFATQLLAPDGTPWRHDEYTVEEAIMQYKVFTPSTKVEYGRYGMEVDEHRFWIETAGPKPYRSCWDGEVEIMELHELQLFLIDFDLDGTDTDLMADIERGRLSSTLGTDHDGHARIVVEPRRGSRITINTLRLMQLGAQAI
jgi:hypothetical protein